MKYNQFQGVQINGSAAPGYSSGQAIAALQDVFKQTMPSEMGYDYMGMSYQEVKASQGVSPGVVFGLSFFIVFLIMAAQYESWTLPLSVLLGVPIAVFGAFAALYLRRLDNNVYAQIGLVMLIGLSAKNAILIVEFAKMEHENGKTLIDAALSGAKDEIASDSDDGICIHSGLRTVMDGYRSGRHLPAGPGHCSDWRHAGCFVARDLLYSCLLRRCRTFWLSLQKGEAATAGKRARLYSRRTDGMISLRACSAIVLTLLISGCKVGPNYNRPTVNTPGQYRGLAPDLAKQSAVQSIAETEWDGVFQDEALQALIKEALINNYDMQIAAARILQARAIVGVTRANQLPNLYGSAGVDYLRNRLAPNGPTIDSVGIQLNYIADFWGKYRRATEAARAQLLATTYGRSVVQTALISDIAIAYFQLRQFDYRLDFSQQAVTADKDILRINTLKYKGGESAITDVYQANLLVQQAEAEVINDQQGYRADRESDQHPAW